LRNYILSDEIWKLLRIKSPPAASVPAAKRKKKSKAPTVDYDAIGLVQGKCGSEVLRDELRSLRKALADFDTVAGDPLKHLAAYMEAWQVGDQIRIEASADQRVEAIEKRLNQATDRSEVDKLQRSLKKMKESVSLELWNKSEWGVDVREEERIALFRVGTTLKTPTAFIKEQDSNGIFVDEQAGALAVFDAADTYLSAMSQPHYGKPDTTAL
jgi:hypothetical protein